MVRILTPLLLLGLTPPAVAQTLEQQLSQNTAGELAASARQHGDARRGAILFHQVHVGCVKCHAVDGSGNSLGPDLTNLKKQQNATDEHIVRSILLPSADIRKGYESVSLLTAKGRTVTGLLVSKSDDGVTVRDPAGKGDRTFIPTDDVEEMLPSSNSIMPAGIVNQLGGRQQFLDLVRYVLEIRDGGLDVARTLQPPPGLITFQLPEYEKNVDHERLIRSLDADALKRGQKIYDRLCINCHGDLEKPGSLPTALRFAEGRFRNGGDPYTMYRTLTHGFGLMVPQTWMVPRQKYDVVHYIRETYVRRNKQGDQYGNITDQYLADLPKGTSLGPEPVEYAPWSDMNYGPSMINTFEVGSDGRNFAYKGIAVRLDAGPGGISKGNKWVVFDHDTLRLAAAWSRPAESKETGFINWEGIHFDGRHGRHPRIVGDLQFQNPTGPGWADPATGLFADDQRVAGRDGRRYGPLPAEWAKYHGLHTLGDQTIVEYSVGSRTVMERFGYADFATNEDSTTDVYSRVMSMGPADKANIMLVATQPDSSLQVRSVTENAVVVGTEGGQADEAATENASRFDGRSWLEIASAHALDMTSHDFTITARIRTRENGTIFCKTRRLGPWIRDGKTFFIRGGRLCYDIGWVGVVRSRKSVNDGMWHDVALTWNHKSGEATFFIDGQKSGGGQLRPSGKTPGHAVRIGFSADNFPNPSLYTGDIQQIAFWAAELSADDLKNAASKDELPGVGKPTAAWRLDNAPADSPVESTGTTSLQAVPVRGGTIPSTGTRLIAGIIGAADSCRFHTEEDRLCLTIPSSDISRNIVVWTASVDAEMSADGLQQLVARIEDRLQPEDLRETITQPVPPRWPEPITTQPVAGPDNGPFAIDVLSTPTANPWFCRIRLAGHDFFEDGDHAAVCSWDGDVWLVSGLKSFRQETDGQSNPQLVWRRIASGLFQPLGVKIVAGDIYLTCRDQLVILRDRNGDGETDFYECFNNDHQVTEHFHEFAMGLQRDDVGNFYYAKSARHALKAVVPHHGTLLRIPSDGSRTDILANGFRAANGVCLNPDGTFIVTDQEGHWNPKNRINWVREGGFYGNMFGYHDVTDSSDDAMQQPLCWITNAFDRSPAELLWVDSAAWGPLNGSLLNLSYGYGKVYVVPHEEVAGQMQGGMCELPIPQFPTGIIRGRINPYDDGLYLTGMFAWASSQQAQEGGFYRLRYTGKPSYMPVVLQARGQQLTIGFTESVDRATATDQSSYAVKTWSLKRTANYGSKHYDEKPLNLTSATLSADGKTVTLTLPDLAPTWCMEIRCRLKSVEGAPFERVIHNTIHNLE